jgi:ABC-type uncharacterized transport system, permease component
MMSIQLAADAAAPPDEKKLKRRKALLSGVGTILFTLLIGFIVGGIIMLLAGYSPLESYRVMFSGVFGTPKGIATAVVKALPIIGTGLSIAFANQCGLFNIGAEGQFTLGTVIAGLAGYFLHLPPFIHPLVVMLLAVLASGGLGALIGFLKSRFGISEVIAGIMFNWIALYGRNALVVIDGFEKSSNVSYPVQGTARLGVLSSWRSSVEGKAYLKEHPTLFNIFKVDINWGIVIIPLLVIFIWFLLKKTSFGYRIKAVGANPFAAEYAGINVSQSYMMALFLAGAISGMAGAIQILGVAPHTVSVLAAQEGYGFDGIAVALMGMNSPIGCILSGLLFSVLRYGGTRLQSTMGVPSETINIMLGFIVLFAGMPGFIATVRKWWNRRKLGQLKKKRESLSTSDIAEAKGGQSND